MSSRLALNSVRTGRQKKTVRLSDLVDRRLATYALVAGAAGVSVAAYAQAVPESAAPSVPPNIPSENTIVYTPANIPFQIYLGGHGVPPPINIDLNGDGITDVGIQLGASGYSLGTADRSYYQAEATWFAAPGNGGIRRPVPAGVEIGPKAGFVGGGLLARSILSNRRRRYPLTGCIGPFKNSSAYWGVRFSIGGETHYGWLRITVNCGSSYYAVTGTVSGYAYQAVPDRPIEAGQTGPADKDEDKDEDLNTKQSSAPATLGMLGLGAAGLKLWRR